MGTEQLNLRGLKVIDASTVLAGPSVGTFLAELGAEVIKVEHPNHPDVTRSWKLASESKEATVSAYFSSINYGKDYVKLNLKNEDEIQQFHELLDSADILLMNFKRSDYQKFGLEDSTLREQYPNLIIGKISGYGVDSDRVAYDLILQAESGFMSINGQPDGPPTKMPVALIDVLAAHHLKEGILLALYARERSGAGTSINVSLYDAAVSSLVNQASNYLMGQSIPKRLGSKHPNIAPYGELFKTKDGVTVTFAIGSDTHFEKLCGVLSLTELVEDSRYRSNQLRVENRESLQKQLAISVAQMESVILLSELEKLNVPAGAIKNLEEVFSENDAKSLIREESIDGLSTKRVTSVIFK